MRQVALGLWIAGALLGLAAVVLGAVGAHALRGRVDAADLDAYEVGVRHALTHAPALLLAAWAASRGSRAGAAAGGCFLAGALLFSGSLVLRTLGAPRGIAAVAPLGGTLFIAGWVALALAGRAALAAAPPAPAEGANS